jgi:ankyrin repeat protein
MYAMSDALYNDIVGNDLGQMKDLLTQGAKHLNNVEEEVSPLLLAASRDHIHMVRWLIQQGHDLNGDIDKDRYTPLMYAAMIGCKASVEILVEAGANLLILNNHKWTAVTCALYRERWEVAEYLLKKGAPFGPYDKDFVKSNNQWIYFKSVASLSRRLPLLLARYS